MTPALAAWLPKSVLMLRDYDRHKFLSDLIAGITVGLVALPLAMAFAIASGLSPQAGLYPTNAPVGPPICVLLPPNAEIINPVMMGRGKYFTAVPMPVAP